MTTYPLFKVHVPVEDALTNLREVLESGYLNEGVQVAKFCEAMQEVLKTDRVVLTNSCTSALTIALRIIGVPSGSSILSTPMTCVATNTPIATTEGKLLWADIDPETGMLDPKDIVKRIRGNTKAIVVVAWGGTPPDLSKLRTICDKYKLKLVLDAAHAMCAEYKGQPVHEHADYTCYSLQAIKHFTTGDGGVLVCKDPKDHERAKRLKWFGFDRDAAKDAQGNWKGQHWNAEMPEAGYKFNMNNVAAAIGLAQLPHIKNIIAAHRLNAQYYDEVFAGGTLIRPLKRPDGAESSFWVYSALVAGNRDRLLERLNAEGIQAGVVHVPNNGYRGFMMANIDLPGTKKFAQTQFSLPCGWWLGRDEVQHIGRRVLELAQ